MKTVFRLAADVYYTAKDYHKSTKFYLKLKRLPWQNTTMHRVQSSVMNRLIIAVGIVQLLLQQQILHSHLDLLHFRC